MPGRSLLVDRFRVLKVLLAMSLLPVSSTFLSAQTLVSISVSPGSASVAAGSTQSFSAIGTYSDNSTQDLSSMANWTSSDYTVASVAGGLANAFNVGQTTIQAKVGGVTGSATLAPMVLPGTPARRPSRWGVTDSPDSLSETARVQVPMTRSCMSIVWIKTAQPLTLRFFKPELGHPIIRWLWRGFYPMH